MRPRSFERGKPTVADGLQFSSKASMRPRSFERGKETIQKGDYSATD